MTTGWKVYQLRQGLARAWLSEPSKKNPCPGPSLNQYVKHEVIGTILTIEHTKRFSSARVLLAHPRAGAHDLGAWEAPVWINVWTSEGTRGEPRGINFCAVTPMGSLPQLEIMEPQGHDEQMQGPPALPPPWRADAAPVDAQPGGRRNMSRLPVPPEADRGEGIAAVAKTR